MKKTNDNGFSLVELIIVIAIIAILAGAMAPALIRYMDNSKKSNDLSSAKAIKTAVETSMANEDFSALLTTGSTTSITDLDGNTFEAVATIVVTPSTPINDTGAGITITPAADYTVDSDTLNAAQTEIGRTLNDKTPKIEFKKAADGTHTPTHFYVYVSSGGSVIVGLGSTSAFYQLCPTLSKYYK